MITVMKFGGTSVGSAEAIQRVANIIINTQGDKVVQWWKACTSPRSQQSEWSAERD